MKIYIVNEKQYCCDGMYHDDIDDNALIKIIRLLLGFASDLSSSTKMSTNSEKAMLSILSCVVWHFLKARDTIATTILTR